MIRKTKFLFLILLLAIALFASDVNAINNENELLGGTNTSPGPTGSIFIGQLDCTPKIEPTTPLPISILKPSTYILPCAGDLIIHKQKHLSTEEMGETRKVDRK